MQQETFRRIGQIIGFSLGLYWLALFLLTHLPIAGSMGKGWHLPFSIPLDKLAHFTAYAGLGALATAWWSWGRMPRRRELLLIAAVIMTYAAVEELTQIPLHRNADLTDWLADFFGMALGLAICRLTWHLGPRWLSSQHLVANSASAPKN